MSSPGPFSMTVERDDLLALLNDDNEFSRNGPVQIKVTTETHLISRSVHHGGHQECTSGCNKGKVIFRYT